MAAGSSVVVVAMVGAVAAAAAPVLRTGEKDDERNSGRGRIRAASLAGWARRGRAVRA